MPACTVDVRSDVWMARPAELPQDDRDVPASAKSSAAPGQGTRCLDKAHRGIALLPSSIAPNVLVNLTLVNMPG